MTECSICSDNHIRNRTLQGNKLCATETVSEVTDVKLEMKIERNKISQL